MITSHHTMSRLENGVEAKKTCVLISIFSPVLVNFSTKLTFLRIRES